MKRNGIENLAGAKYGPQGWSNRWNRPRGLSRVTLVLKDTQGRALQNPDIDLTSQSLVGSTQKPNEQVVVDLRTQQNLPTLPKVTW